MATLLAVVGPTGSGKSDLALTLAEALGGEVVGCDALQLRAGLPILTAKPDAAALLRVPHHLIGALPLEQAGTAARYVTLAEEVIGDLRRRGRGPILCGGTGLYLRALRGGLFEGPSADPEVRAALRAEAAALGVAALHARLAGIDPEAAARIAPADYVRIERALEVHALTGRPISALQRESQAQPPRHGIVGVALDPGEPLRQRIAARAARMIEEGVLAEVAAVAAAHPGLSSPPLGYAEVLRAARGELSRAALRDELARLTIQYARRQRTWFRKEPGLRWFSSATEVDAGMVAAALQRGAW